MTLPSTPSTPDLTAQILQDRARALARVPESAPPAETMLELLEFRLAQERYAVESLYVSEVCPLKDLTPLPCTPPFILGIVNLRGQVLPVLDFKKLFDLPGQGLTDLHRVIVIRGHGLELGLLADMTVGIRSVPVESLGPPLPTLTGIRSDYLKGVVTENPDSPECLIVLDLAHLLNDPKIVVHEEVDRSS